MNTPDYYIYQADVYCVACTKAIKRRLREVGTVPAHPNNEHTYDSNEYPKGPFSDEESDSPQHCGNGENCLDPTIINGEAYGKFFENPLTSAGMEFIRGLMDGPVKKFWLDFYRDSL